MEQQALNKIDATEDSAAPISSQYDLSYALRHNKQTAESAQYILEHLGSLGLTVSEATDVLEYAKKVVLACTKVNRMYPLIDLNVQ